LLQVEFEVVGVGIGSDGFSVVRGELDALSGEGSSGAVPVGGAREVGDGETSARVEGMRKGKGKTHEGASAVKVVAGRFGGIVDQSESSCS
jgi:methyl-accepting chemotaxis protein